MYYPNAFAELTAQLRHRTAQERAAVADLFGQIYPHVQARLKDLGAAYQKHRGFNIFKEIAEHFRREKLHTHILLTLLDPHTPDIGNAAYLSVFLQQLSVFLKRKKHPDFAACFELQGAQVLEERGDIDLLITNGRQCIIVENKIKDAVDQPNQLCRYYHWCQGQGLTVLGIIYLPLTPTKEPPIHGYHFEEEGKNFCSKCRKCEKDADYLERTKETLNELTYVLTVDKLAAILQEFSRIPAKEDARVFIAHYTDLIREIGEREMTKETDKKILREIFSSTEKLETAEAITEIWSRRANLAREILAEDIAAALSAKGYAQREDDVAKVDGSIWVKELAHPNFSRIVFKPAWLTFALEIKAPQFAGQAREKLKDPSCEAFPYTTAVAQQPYPNADSGKWIYRNFKADNLSEPLEKAAQKCVQCFDNLEKLLG